MKTITLYRRDFAICQDGSGDSLFDDVLSNLGIPEDKWEDIGEVEIQVESFEIIE